MCDNPLECYLTEIKKYMTKINVELDQLRETKAQDVIEVVPENMIHSDKTFMTYILEHNERFSFSEHHGLCFSHVYSGTTTDTPHFILKTIASKTFFTLFVG